MMEFELSGVEEAVATVRRIGESVKGPQMTEGALAALEPVAEDARELAPVRYGQLRDGIVVSDKLPDGGEAEFDGRAVFVGLLTGEPFYGGFVELGTVKMRATPFLAPAIDANEDLIFEILGENTGQLILEAI